ncbi:MAG: hypothetical protein H6707_21240 [Deltaproteobacteria bacterium]|nr:hypothetical protein [Deltaproteobacteria bacterium]
MSRQRRTVVEHLVYGVVGGGMFGPGLAIKTREDRLLRFSRAGALWDPMPDSGEFRVDDSSAGTEVTCRLWCRGMALRALVIGVIAAAIIAANVVSRLPWIWAGVATFAGALLCGTIAGWRDRLRLRRQLRVYLENTRYLSPL